MPIKYYPEFVVFSSEIDYARLLILWNLAMLCKNKILQPMDVGGGNKN